MVYTIIPHQLQRQAAHGVEPIIHLPEATALIMGWAALGSGATLCGLWRRRWGLMPAGLKHLRVSELRRPPDLHTLLPQADFVVMTVPHTPETRT